MDLLVNDLAKLRCTHIAAVLCGVPLIAVAFGAANYSANSGTLSAGWQSYWSQATLFYGMLFMVVGIAIIAAAAWRVEHRGGNWHTLLTSSRSAGTIAAAKLGAIATLTLLMQLIFIVCSLAGGWMSGLSGMPPWTLPASSLIAVLPAVAVAAWQSFLSMVIRNFAMPVALGALTGIASFGSIAAGAHAMQFVLPPVGLSKALWMGSSAVADSSALDLHTVASISLSAAVLAAAGWLASTVYLHRVDVNA